MARRLANQSFTILYLPGSREVGVYDGSDRSRDDAFLTGPNSDDAVRHLDSSSTRMSRRQPPIKCRPPRSKVRQRPYHSKQLKMTGHVVNTEIAPSIDVKNLSYKFQDGSSGLKDVFLDLPPGSRTLLIGGSLTHGLSNMGTADSM
jgi:hypothetical protein